MFLLKRCLWLRGFWGFRVAPLRVVVVVLGLTHRLLSSSFLWFIFRLL